MVISPGICLLLVIYCLLFVAYLGWGKLGASVLGLELPEGGGCFPFVWLGWAISLVLLQAIHLFLPISANLSTLFFVAGLFFSCCHRPGWRGLFAGLRSLRAGYLLILIVGGAWIAGHALTEPKLVDSGVYQFNTIRWLLDYPLIPGLGNLHGRLAFNQTFFAYVASLHAFHPLAGGHNLANSFLLILLLADCTFPLFVRADPRSEHRRLMLLVKAACIPLIFIYGKNFALSSPSPDLGSSLLRVVLFYSFVEILARLRTGQRDTAGIKLTALLATVAITVKLSNIMYAATLFGLSILLYFARRSALPDPGKGKMGRYICFLLLAICLWAGRGVMLSGCPAYPSSAFCLDVEWAVPAEQVEAEAALVYSSTRGKSTSMVPQDYLRNPEWMAKWFHGMWQWKAGFAYPASVALLAVLAAGAAIAWTRNQEQRSGNALLALAMAPPLSALLFWFLTAPDPRFADPYLLLLALAGFLPWLIPPIKSRLIAFAFPLSIFLLINGPLYLAHLESKPGRPLVLTRSPYPEPVPQAAMKKFTTLSGLEVYTPVHDRLCWDSPVPATPHENPNLRLRGDSIGSGFVSRK